MIKRALKVSLVVGLTLTLIHQYDQFRTFSFSCRQCLRLAMNFLVPFLVSLYSSTRRLQA